MFKLVVLTALLAVAVAKPSGVIAPIAYAHAPVVHKTITYASEPVVTGYSENIIKPDLSYSLATPVETVQKHTVLAPARTVVDIQPEITVAHAPVAHSAVVHAPIAHAAVAHHEPVIAKVGEIVEKVPTAVSHQSQTIVHNSAKVVTPIVAPVATKTVITPAHLSVAAPVHTGGVIAAKTVVAHGGHLAYSHVPLEHGTIVAAGPIAYSAPLHTKSIAYHGHHHPLTYGAPVVHSW